jgi:hypothetical protein
MEVEYIEYRVPPNPNVPDGMGLIRLPVLSPRWQGSELTIRFPDGEDHLLIGWSTSQGGSPANLQIFWTRHEIGAPPVCLVLGGDAGLRNLGSPGEERPESPDVPSGQGYPLLALAESLIPTKVLEVIGPAPEIKVEKEILLLL